MASRNHVVLWSEEVEPVAPAVTSSPVPTQSTPPPVVTLTEAEERAQQEAFDWWKREIDMRLKEFFMTPTEAKTSNLIVQLMQYKANFAMGSIKPPRFSR